MNISSGMLKINKIYSIHVVQLFIATVVRRFCRWYSFPSAVHRCRAAGKASITIQVADIVVFHCYSSSSSPLLPLGLHRSNIAVTGVGFVRPPRFQILGSSIISFFQSVSSSTRSPISVEPTILSLVMQPRHTQAYIFSFGPLVIMAFLAYCASVLNNHSSK